MASKNRTSPSVRASKLSATTNERRNTKAGREKMAPSQFGLPDQKAYRIDDLPHARNALARVAQFGTPTQQAEVKARVAKKYPSLRRSPSMRAGRA